MLHADKELLEKATTVRLIGIREAELHLYARNCNRIALVSSIMAGIAYFGLIYTTKMAYFQDAGLIAQFFYTLTLTVSMCISLLNIMATVMTSMLGPGLALRGKQGSIHLAVAGMLAELEMIVTNMHLAMYVFIGTTIAYAWGAASPNWVASVLITAVAVLTGAMMHHNTVAVERSFPMRTVALTTGAFYAREDHGDGQPGSSPASQGVVHGGDNASGASPAQQPRHRKQPQPQLQQPQAHAPRHQQSAEMF